MRKSSKIVLPAIATALVLALAGCGAGEQHAGGHDPSAPADSAVAATFAQADVTFAQQMIPHHQQAIEMAELVPGRTTTSAVTDLAKAVEQAQRPEIDQLNQALQRFGAPAGGGGHAGHGGDGMMSDEQMTRLRNATGADFDRQWLELMVEHHQGAVEMARTELAQGADSEMKALAQRVIDAQETEISVMNGLLGR